MPVAENRNEDGAADRVVSSPNMGSMPTDGNPNLTNLRPDVATSVS
jgi:hypothetical protein